MSSVNKELNTINATIENYSVRDVESFLNEIREIVTSLCNFANKVSESNEKPFVNVIIESNKNDDQEPTARVFQTQVNENIIDNANQIENLRQKLSDLEKFLWKLDEELKANSAAKIFIQKNILSLEQSKSEFEAKCRLLENEKRHLLSQINHLEQDCESNKERIRDYESEKRKLEEGINKIEKEMNDFKLENKDLKNQNSNLNSEFEKNRKTYEELDRIKSECIENVNDLCTKVKDQNNKLNEELGTLKIENEHLRSELERLKEISELQITNLNESLEEKDAQVNEQNKKIKLYEEETKSLLQKLNNQQHQFQNICNELTNKMNESNTNAKDFEGKWKSMVSATETLGEKVKIQNGEIDQLKINNETHKGEYKTLQTRFEMLKKQFEDKINEHNSSTRKFEMQINQLNMESEKLRQNIQRNQQDLNTMTQQKTQVEQELTKAKERVSELERIINENSIFDMKLDIIKFRDANELLSLSNKETKERNVSFQNQIKDLEQEKENLQNVFDKHVDEIKKLKAEIRNLTNENRDVTQLLREKEQRLNELENLGEKALNYESLLRENEILTDKIKRLLNKLNNELRHKERDVSQVESTLDGNRNKYESLLKDIETVNRQIKEKRIFHQTQRAESQRYGSTITSDDDTASFTREQENMTNALQVELDRKRHELNVLVERLNEADKEKDRIKILLDRYTDTNYNGIHINVSKLFWERYNLEEENRKLKRIIENRR